MRGGSGGRIKLLAAIVIVGGVVVAGQKDGRSQELSYLSGHPVIPLYQVHAPNADGSFTMHFGYLNKNWQEEVDVPIGPDNTLGPGPTVQLDAGQPTHFLPRDNRWQFTVRVPADWGTKEIVWTLASHGHTYRAYGVLKPGYIVDDYVIQHEFGSDSTHGRKDPVLTVEGGHQRSVKVGQSVELVAVATDPNPPPAQRGARGRATGGAAGTTAQPADAAPAQSGRARGGSSLDEVGPGAVGGDSIRTSPTGLRFAWYVYREAGPVLFDPPMPFKVWEDQRGGSPWAPGWQPPPIPPGNKWVYSVTFQKAGTYVLRALPHNGSRFTYENITFTVTPS